MSASVPQLAVAIKELQSQGYNIPNYPEDPQNDAEKDIKARYAKVLGSAVNPVLREGNSDRRVAAPVKQYAKDNPHSMGKWSTDSRTHVSHMTAGDFYGSEKSVVMAQAGDVKIEFVDAAGNTTVLKPKTSLKVGEVIDSSVMSCGALRKFYAEQIADAKNTGSLAVSHAWAPLPLPFSLFLSAGFCEPSFGLESLTPDFPLSFSSQVPNTSPCAR